MSDTPTTEAPKPWAACKWLTPKLDAILSAMDETTALRATATMTKHLASKSNRDERAELIEYGMIKPPKGAKDTDFWPSESAMVAELNLKYPGVNLPRNAVSRWRKRVGLEKASIPDCPAAEPSGRCYKKPWMAWFEKNIWKKKPAAASPEHLDALEAGRRTKIAQMKTAEIEASQLEGSIIRLDLMRSHFAGVGARGAQFYDRAFEDKLGVRKLYADILRALGVPEETVLKVDAMAQPELVKFHGTIKRDICRMSEDSKKQMEEFRKGEMK